MRSIHIWFTALFSVAFAGCGEKPFEQFKSPDGKFSILFPGLPKVQNRAGHGSITVTEYSVHGLSWGYFVTHYELPATIKVTTNNVRNILNSEADGAFKYSEGHKESSKNVRLLDKYDGIELEGTFAKPKKLEVCGRMFIVGHRLYNVMVMGSAEKIKSDIATQFLDSFTVN